MSEHEYHRDSETALAEQMDRQYEQAEDRRRYPDPLLAAQETVLLRTCGWCRLPMGSKPGQGISGETTGICPDCEERLLLVAPLREDGGE